MIREQYSGIVAMFSHYYYLKHKLQNTKSNFPPEERFKNWIQVVKPMEAKSIREAMFAFIGDMEIFLDKKLEWWEKVILCSRIVADGDYPRSYGEIVIDLRGRMNKMHRDGKDCTYPRRLCFRQNVRREFFRLHSRAKDYFRERGYVQ